MIIKASTGKFLIKYFDFDDRSVSSKTKPDNSNISINDKVINSRFDRTNDKRSYNIDVIIKGGQLKQKDILTKIRYNNNNMVYQDLNNYNNHYILGNKKIWNFNKRITKNYSTKSNNKSNSPAKSNTKSNTKNRNNDSKVKTVTNSSKTVYPASELSLSKSKDFVVDKEDNSKKSDYISLGYSPTINITKQSEKQQTDINYTKKKSKEVVINQSKDQQTDQNPKKQKSILSVTQNKENKVEIDKSIVTRRSKAKQNSLKIEKSKSSFNVNDKRNKDAKSQINVDTDKAKLVDNESSTNTKIKEGKKYQKVYLTKRILELQKHVINYKLSSKKDLNENYENSYKKIKEKQNLAKTTSSVNSSSWSLPNSSNKQVKIDKKSKITKGKNSKGSKTNKKKLVKAKKKKNVKIMKLNLCIGRRPNIMNYNIYY